MTARAEVERDILDDEALLSEVATLIEHRVELSAWPEAARTALAVALSEETMSRSESWKRTALERHLFGAGATVPASLTSPPSPTARQRRHAEHLRSGLLSLVRFRAAAKLR